MASLVRVVSQNQDIPATATFIPPKTMPAPTDREDTVRMITVAMCTTRELGIIERICNFVKGIVFGVVYILTLGCCLQDKAIMQLFAKYEITYYHYQPENTADLCRFISDRVLPEIEAKEDKSVIASSTCGILDETSLEIMKQMNLKELLNIIKVLSHHSKDPHEPSVFTEALLKHVCNSESLLKDILLTSAKEWLHQYRSVIFSNHEMYPAYVLIGNSLGDKNLGIDIDQAKNMLKQLTDHQDGNNASEYAKRVDTACLVVAALVCEDTRIVTRCSYFEGLHAAIHGTMRYIEKYKNSVPGYRNSSPYQNSVNLSSLRAIAKQCGHLDFVKAIDGLSALPVQRPRDL